jgi:hypothetical protein
MKRAFWLSGDPIPWVFALLDRIPGRGKASFFEDDTALGLRAFGYRVIRQFIVPSRGDRMRGRIDILASRAAFGELLALELDGAVPRKKSIFKVQQVKGATTRLVYCREAR